MSKFDRYADDRDTLTRDSHASHASRTKRSEKNGKRITLARKADRAHKYADHSGVAL